MKIELTFDSLEDLQTGLRSLAPFLSSQSDATAPVTASAAPPVESNEPPVREPSPAYSSQPSPAPAEQLPAAPNGYAGILTDPAPASPDAAPFKVPTLVEVRRKLSDLNHRIGRNVAAEIIKSTAGVDRLTDVPDDKLAAVAAAADAFAS